MADLFPFPRTVTRRTFTGTLAAGAAGLVTCPSWGQTKKTKDGPPDPEPISLETKDGVQLRATYYGGTLKKKAVPILMIHGWKGQQDEFRMVARGLQANGHAVLTVDLRGHGLSTVQRTPQGDKELEPDKLRANDIERMVMDLEACKRFLVDKNNAGELNVSALCLVAAEFGTIPAMRWTLIDWSAARLPSYKQGQDVQAVALLSPVETFKGVTARPALSHQLIRGKTISKLICVGADDPKALSDAKRLHSTLERFHGKPPPREQAAEKQDLFFVTADTQLQGTELLDLAAFKIGDNLLQFVKLRLVARMDAFPWEERRNPLGE